MNYNLDKKEFLVQHLTEGKSYQNISEEYSIPREILSKWWDDGIELRNEIKRANQLFNGRNGKEEFLDFQILGKRAFYEWFVSQPKTCAYCGIEEYKLKVIFDKGNGLLKTKRGRGRTLELERKDSNSNKYSKGNCVLACYMCNNHKSDLISEEEHIKYFSSSIKRYLEDKFLETK